MLTTEQRHLGQSKLSDQAKSSQALDGNTYALLENELNKLISVHASEPIDWQKVSTLAQQFLQHEGKDLNVATWLAVAWANTHSVIGLSAGLEVLDDLHQHYWSEMTPPLKRLRARRNQIQWFIDQITRMFELQTSAFELPEADYESALTHAKSLDSFWQDNDDEAPVLYRLVSLLQTIQPSVAENITAPTHKTEVEPEPEPKPKPRPVVDELKAVDFSDLTLLSANNDLQLEKNIDSVFSTLMRGLGELPDALLNEPLLYRLNRVAAWLTLEQSPPAQDGTTRLAPPTSIDLETLTRLEETQNGAADSLHLLRFIESRVFSQLYWLDLHRIAFEAAKQLPKGDLITNTIMAETRLLMQRVPELAQLHYQDGQPFADDKTKAWLARLEQSSQHKTITPTVTTITKKTLEHTPTSCQGNSTAVIALLAAAQAEAQIAKNALMDLEQRLATGLNQYIRIE